MIDLHCHILPGVDDGSKNIEQSVKIAINAKQAGFETICCTPHYLEPDYTSSRKENLKILNELRYELQKQNININLVLGNEVYINENASKLLDDEIISTIGNTNYILMELPLFQEIKYVNQIFGRVQDKGLKIILAHPERYRYVQENPNILINYIESGLILQGNYASIIGKYGDEAKKTIKKILRAKMIHLLASDVHRENSIYNKMDIIKEKINDIVDEDYFHRITEINPIRIINNESVEKFEYKKIKKSLFF